MAKSKLELAAETGSFEGGLKRAMTAMRNFEDSVGGLGNATKEQNENMAKFAQMMGNMETTAKSAKGKVNELKNTFTELSATYNKLTDKEKNSPFGQAMAQSLNQLKDRIQQSNSEMQQIRQQMDGTKESSDNASGGLDALAGKFGLSIGQMAKFSAIAAAVTAAMKVCKDAFFANEEQLDDWGRTCESAQSLYNGFLNALNTGDIQGYLSRMDKIVEAANEAYNAMDRLGTFKAFNQRNELIGRNNLQNAINNYREGKGSKEDVKKAGDAYIDELKKRQTLESANYAAQIRKVAAEKGVDSKELTKILTGDHATYEKAKSVRPTGERYETVSVGNTGYKETRKIAYATNAQEKMGEALRMFNDTALNEIQRIGTEEIQTSIEIEQVRRQVDRATGVKKTVGGGGSKSSPTFKAEKFNLSDEFKEAEIGTTESMNTLKARMAIYVKELGNVTTSSAYEAVSALISQLQKEIDAQPLALKLGISTEAAVEIETQISNLGDNMRSKMKGMQVPIDSKGFKEASKDASVANKNFQNAASAIGSVGSAMQNLEDPGAKVAGMIAQAIASVMAGFATALASPVNAAGGVWTWIAASAAGLATAVATVAQIKSVTSGYADGGWVTGGSHVGDAIPAFLNAGEYVMTANDINKANSNLEYAYASGAGGGRSTISGEQIVTVVNAYGRRTGRGEILR